MLCVLVVFLIFLCAGVICEKGDMTEAQGFIRRWSSRSVRGGGRKRRVGETLSVRQPDDPCPTVDLRAAPASPPSSPPD